MKNELNKIFDYWKVDNVYENNLSLDEWLKNNFSKKYICDDDMYNLDYFLSELSSVLPKDIYLNLYNMQTEGFMFQVIQNEIAPYIVYEQYVDELPFKDLDTLNDFIIRLQNKY